MSAPLSAIEAAEDAPAATALVVGERHIAYGELGRLVAAVSLRMAERGFDAATRVALRATSSLDTVVASLALIDRGVPFVPLHPRLTLHEAKSLVADAEPCSLLDETTLASMVDEAARGDGRVQTACSVDDGATLALLYTSGTSGRPKAALLPRRAFIASARASTRNLGWRADDRWLLCMPLAHVGGLSILTRCLIARRCVVLQPRFDADAALDAIARQGVTLLSVVPTMLRALLARDRNNALARLRAVLVGGAHGPAALLDECARRGVFALTTYGLTEACSQVTVQRLGEAPTRRAGAGLPIDGAEVAIVDAGGHELEHGAVGRVRVRGPVLMSGYLGGAPLGDDWFDTGDLGELDDEGHLHVHARREDLIVTGGENVYPVEIEQVVEAFEGVAQALVFGVRDDVWGEVVAALVRVDAASFPGERPLAEHLADKLASYKRPRRLAVVGALPLTSSGKLERSSAPRFEGLLRPFPR